MVSAISPHCGSHRRTFSNCGGMKWLPIAVVATVGAVSVGCSSETINTEITIELYAAEGMEYLLEGNSPANTIETVVVQGSPENRRRDREEFTLSHRSGSLDGFDEGTNYQIFVRGYQDDAGNKAGEPAFFGGTRPFDIVSGVPVSVAVQLGRTNCMGINRVIPSAADQSRNADMFYERVGHTMTELADGRVVVIGGAKLNKDGTMGTFHKEIEIYDPNRGGFTIFEEPLSVGRAYHTATLLEDGTVLVYGGWTVTNPNAANAQAQEVGFLFVLDVGRLSQRMLPKELGPELRRLKHQATRLSDGSVLITGGQILDGTPLSTTYRYIPDPSGAPELAELARQGGLAHARTEHTASFASGGLQRVVIAGGLGRSETDEMVPLDSIEEFVIGRAAECHGGGDPRADWGCFSKASTATLRAARFAHQAVVVDEGRQVMFVGGYTTTDRSEVAKAVELLAGDLTLRDEGEIVDLPVTGGELTATGLVDDTVLVLGGRQGASTLNASYRLTAVKTNGTGVPAGIPTISGYYVESIFIESDSGPAICGMTERRYGHQAVAMKSGPVLVTGGGIRVQVPGGSIEDRASRRADLYFPAAIELQPYYPYPEPPPEGAQAPAQP